MKYSIWSLFIILSATTIFISCEDDSIDVLELRERELEVIRMELQDQGITDYDSTASGLFYYYPDGEGQEATLELGQYVNVAYEGWRPNYPSFDKGELIIQNGNGSILTEGDSCYTRQGTVIAGWIEAISLMKNQEKARFYIPSYLAYGTTGSGTSIPANATLVFDIEVLNIVQIDTVCGEPRE